MPVIWPAHPCRCRVIDDFISFPRVGPSNYRERIFREGYTELREEVELYKTLMTHGSTRRKRWLDVSIVY